MSSYQKYYDLSSDEEDANSLDSGSSSSSEESIGHTSNRNNNSGSRVVVEDGCDSHSLWSRTILHIDIDCFYVQCEEIDKCLRDSLEGEMQRPLAIGQKHIVVTCNYVARSRGVTKLMSKTDAMRICPDLRIVDGSDLRRYRTHSRTVYEAFRTAVQDEIGSVLNSIKNNSGKEIGGRTQSTFRDDRGIYGIMKDGRQHKEKPMDTKICLPCKRNAMDEMMADISVAVDKLVLLESENGNGSISRLLSQTSRGLNNELSQPPQEQVSKIYVFGDDVSSSTVRIVEDQSGASSKIVFRGGNTQNEGHSSANRSGESLAPSRRNVHEGHSVNNPDKNVMNSLRQRRLSCRNRLEIAVRLAQLICESIFRRTRFHVSTGISVSPMLAKLAVIKKPETINVLLPWRSPDLLYFMPLRKMNEIGSRTFRALSQALLSVPPHSTKTSSAPSITVYDFLGVPREKIVEALLMMVGRENGDRRKLDEIPNHKGPSSSSTTDRYSCEQKCDLLLERCRGLDSTIVEDDDGGLPQTVSVENSFRRGTMTTEAAAQDALSELCRRLPPLIEDRGVWSRDSSLAYPTTLRITIRSVRNEFPESQRGRLRRNSRHVTRSKQASIGVQRGKELLIPAGLDASSKDRMRAEQILQNYTKKLLEELLSHSGKSRSVGRADCINITRMNLAVANFQDMIPKDRPSQSPFSNLKTLKSIRNNEHSQPSPNGTVDYGNLSQRQWECDTKLTMEQSSYFQRSQIKKRKDAFTTTSVTAKSRKRGTFPATRSLTDRSSNISRKHLRTRIDHFFAKK